jgi:hypothetical protein
MWRQKAMVEMFDKYHSSFLSDKIMEAPFERKAKIDSKIVHWDIEDEFLWSEVTCFEEAEIKRKATRERMICKNGPMKIYSLTCLGLKL